VITASLTSCRDKSQALENQPSAQYCALSSKVRQLGSMDFTDNISALVAGQIYETLYQYHYLNGLNSLICRLAEAMPQVSDDLIYTIKIK